MTNEENGYGAWVPFDVSMGIKSRIQHRETEGSLEIKALAPEVVLVIFGLVVSVIPLVMISSFYTGDNYTRDSLITSLCITIGLAALIPFTARWKHVAFHRSSGTIEMFKETCAGIKMLRSTINMDDVRDLDVTTEPGKGMTTIYRIILILEPERRVTIHTEGESHVVQSILALIRPYIKPLQVSAEGTIAKQQAERAMRAIKNQKRATVAFVVLLANAPLCFWPLLGLPVPNQAIWDGFLSLVASGSGLMVISIVGEVMYVLLTIAAAINMRFVKEGRREGWLFGLIIFSMIGSCLAVIVFISFFGIPIVLLIVGTCLTLPVPGQTTVERAF